MSYQAMFSFAFVNLPGLTLNAKLFDNAGSQTGATITTGFSDLGDGAYQYLATIPDGHVGTLKIYDSAQPSRCIPLSVNPQEIENADVKISNLIGVNGANLTALAAQSSLDDLSVKIGNPDGPNVSADIAQVYAHVSDTVSILNSLNNLSTTDIDNRLTAYGTATTGNINDLSAKIGNPDGVSVSADIAQLTTNLNDVAIAVSALNNITAADVVTALMAYAVESGKDYATVLKEVYAILRGKFVANAADPTTVDFYAPDGTTVRVTHTLTDTTRTPS